MRKCAPIIAATLLLLLLVACTPSGAYVTVYRSVAPHYRTTGEQLRTENVSVEPGTDFVASLIYAFNSYPAAQELENPLPRDCKILDYRRTGDLITLEVSESYGTLTCVEKTIADCCIALTFCEVDGVNAVKITSGDLTLTRRLTGDEIIFKD